MSIDHTGVCSCTKLEYGVKAIGFWFILAMLLSLLFFLGEDSGGVVLIQALFYVPMIISFLVMLCTNNAQGARWCFFTIAVI